MRRSMSPLSQARLDYQPKVPKRLNAIQTLICRSRETLPIDENARQKLETLFPHLVDGQLIDINEGEGATRGALRVGALFSGGQAAGGHNVLSGLYDALKAIHPDSRLIGLIGGPKGLILGRSEELTGQMIDAHRNQGGFDLIGSGRDKVEKEQDFQSAAAVVQSLDLDGLVVIGGDDSNTNAAFLAEYFLKYGINCRVIGVPKTIDGDLTNDFVETSFGFDTACKTYSEIIGNIARDALSAGKYYFFIKLMGRSASHIALECALQTQPNMTLIGEEVARQKQTLKQVVDSVADLISERAKRDLHHGVILIPEGIVEFIPEMKQLISELNAILAKDGDLSSLSDEARSCYQTLPSEIRDQLLKDRDPHGNVQVSKIESERLLIQMVKEELKRRGDDYQGKFSAQGFFCGYEGRSCLPSNFDADYCYSLGQVAAVLIGQNRTGVMAALTHLFEPVENWRPIGVPLVPLMGEEERKGKTKIVIKKSYVELNGPLFERFKKGRDKWRLVDHYQYPGPIQFYGPESICDAITRTLEMKRLTHAGSLKQ